MATINAIRTYLDARGQADRTDAIIEAYDNCALPEHLSERGVSYLGTDELATLLRDHNAAQQHVQCRRWATLLEAAGYIVELVSSGSPRPFDLEWQVWENAELLATFDIDGCGASWHGPDDLWTRAIGPSEGVTK